ncbi:ABC transporter permease (plasmid) [Haloferacaceae archaeon DSL9]
MMFWISLLDGLPPGASFTLENYTRIFDGIYLNVLWRTISLTVQTTVLVTVLGYTLAYSMVRFTKRTTIVLLLIILPFWTNYIVRMYALINIFQNGGVLSWALNLVGLANGDFGIMYTNEAVLLGLTYVWLPLATLPFYASLTNFDTDLIDAAKDLGAGPLKAFFTVTLPMTFNGLLAGVVLVAIPAFGSFVTPELLGGTDQIMIGNLIDQQFNQAFNWPLGASLGIVVSVFMVLMLIISAKIGSRVLARHGGSDE